MDLFGDGGGRSVKVAVYAALTYDVISATNSSPQTTEINAAARADTLMKWVKLGLAQAALFAAIGIAVDDEHWPPALGAGLAGVMLWLQYEHAKDAGLAKGGATTESYGPSSSSRPYSRSSAYEPPLGTGSYPPSSRQSPKQRPVSPVGGERPLVATRGESNPY